MLPVIIGAIEIVVGTLPAKLLYELDNLKSSLDSNFRTSSSQETCGNGLGLVKDEVYKGNIDTQKVVIKLKKSDRLRN
jgi:hypothetical protein